MSDSEKLEMIVDLLVQYDSEEIETEELIDSIAQIVWPGRDGSN